MHIHIDIVMGWIQDWDHNDATQIVTELCGFITILSGTFLLHKTKDMGCGTTTTSPALNAQSENGTRGDSRSQEGDV